jgi:hypothetical protein
VLLELSKGDHDPKFSGQEGVILSLIKHKNETHPFFSDIYILHIQRAYFIEKNLLYRSEMTKRKLWFYISWLLHI